MSNRQEDDKLTYMGLHHPVLFTRYIDIYCCTHATRLGPVVCRYYVSCNYEWFNQHRHCMDDTRFDGHSNEALEHLETIMDEMDKLEDTLEEASTMVTNFTGDLGEAQGSYSEESESI